MSEQVTCPSCHTDNLYCAFCGEFLTLCDCGRSEEAYCFQCELVVYLNEVELREPDCDCDDADSAKLVCETCRVYRSSLTEPWQWQATTTPTCICNPEKEKECKRCGVVRHDAGDEWRWESKNLYYGYKCRHYDHRVEFPSGVVVYGSSMRDREANEEAPDFGLYLDGGWEPAGMNVRLHWKDYGLPGNWALAVKILADAYKRAEQGFWVEVGCIGGHGRTGAALACLAVLDGMSAAEAIDFVRDVYCVEAIETDEQEWFIDWFDCYVHGGTTAPVPPDRWLTKKELKKWRKKPPVQYTYDGFDWRQLQLEPTVTGRKPEYEYGAQVSRTVRMKPKKDKKTTYTVTDGELQEIES